MCCVNKFQFAAVILLFAVSNVYGQICPASWHGYTVGPGSKCYRFNNNRMTWQDARDFCQIHGGDILKIDSAAERNWIFGELKKMTNNSHTTSNWWVGLNNREYIAQWEWADGTPIGRGILTWARGAPDNANGTERCGEIVSNSHFNDETCSDKNSVLCSRDREIPLTCDADHGWQTTNGQCYIIMTSPQDFEHAKFQCNMNGGSLVTVDNQADQIVLHDFAVGVGKPLWIGLYTVKTGNTATWMWTNGSYLTTSYWHGTPHVARSALNSTCAVVSNGLTAINSWDPSSCSTERPFVCRKPEGVCFPGWIGHRTNCYQFNVQYRSTFSAADRYCSDQGADLLKIGGVSDQIFIRSYLDEIRDSGVTSVWIGASDNNNDEGPFKWRDGQPVSFSYWSGTKAPPNTPEKQDCVYIPTNDVGKWRSTSNCQTNRAFICRTGMGMPVHPVESTPPPHYGCPKLWVRHLNNCFKVTDSKYDWLSGRTFCQNLSPGANLAVIKTSSDQGYVNSLLQKDMAYWVGLNDRTTEGTWIWNDDPAALTYTRWRPHEPNNYRSGENCGSVINNAWNDARCTSKYFVICSKLANSVFPSLPPTTPPVDWTIKCGIGWESSPLSDNCYMFMEEPLTWLNAFSQCRAYHGTLVAIETIQEQHYIAGRISRMKSVALWTGANDRSTEGGWRWANRAPFAFFNWAEGQPSKQGTGRGADCVAMLTATATWDDVDCNTRNGYICEKKGHVPHTRAPPTTTVKVPAGMVMGCRPGWRPFEQSCYLIRRDRKNWQDAKTYCGRVSAKLVSIQDREEQNFIQANIPKSNNAADRMWIGLSDTKVENDFIWADGSLVTYTNWNNMEPNNWKDLNEDCVDIWLKSGKWNDEPCQNRMLGYICEAPKRPVSATQSPYQQGCPRGSQGYGSYCYKMFIGGNARDWNGAIARCNQTVKGTLATVNDRYLSAFLSSQLVYRSGYFWIGLSDQAKAGTLAWLTGDTVLYSNWYANHTGNEQNTCVAMRASHPKGLWETRDCTTKNNYFCQFARVGYTPPTRQTWPNVPCAPGWTASRDKCYKAYTDTSNLKTWMEARAYCQAVGGDLASFHNNNNDTFMITLLQNAKQACLWIGLNDRGTEGEYTWSDGSPVDYTNWGKTEPNDYKHQEDCVVLAMDYNNGKWVDNSCYISHMFICAVPRGTDISIVTTPAVPSISPQCGPDPGWYFYQNYCYQLSPVSGPNASLTWYDAGPYCADRGATLTSLHSLSENEFLLALISKRSQRSYWTGFNQLSSGGYIWTDGTPTDFSNWNPGEPNDYYGAEKCVVMRSNYGWWNDLQCNYAVPFICKKPANGVAQLVTPAPYPAGGCNKGFTRVPGGRNKCFLLGGADNYLNFTQARDRCRKYGLGYDIASIEDLYEQAFMMKMAGAYGKQIWIGLNDRLTNNKFMWQDNAPLIYTHWDRGEPTSGQAGHPKANTQNCVIARMTKGHAGMWADKNCASHQMYLCQSRQDPTIHIRPTPDPCKPGYQSYRSNCYRLSTSLKSWTDAQTDCSNDGGHLVSIINPWEQAHVITVANGNVPYWIGLSDARIPGLYGWSDGWPVQYSNWGRREPSYDQGQGQTGGTQGCVAANQNGKWNDTDCSRKLNYICKISSDLPPVTTMPTGGACSDPTWIPNGEFCYVAAVNTGRSWPEASYACQELGMQLASVHSKEEMDFVFTLVKQAKVTDPNFQPNIWLGMSKDPGGSYKWSDDSAVNFLFWRQGEPTVIGANGEMQECIEFNKNQETWDDISCFQKRGYVCKVNKAFAASGNVVGNAQSQRQGTNSNLSGSSVAGVVIGVAVAIAVAVFVLLFLRRRGTITLPSRSTTSFDNPLAYDGEIKVNDTRIDSDS